MKKLLLTLLVVLTCSRGFQVNKRFNIHAISAWAFNVVEKESSDAALKTASAALTHKTASKTFRLALSLPTRLRCSCHGLIGLVVNFQITEIILFKVRKGVSHIFLKRRAPTLDSLFLYQQSVAVAV